MKKSVVLIGLGWKILFSFFFVLSFSELLFRIPVVRHAITTDRQIFRDELYDPSLTRINSLEKLEVQIDSLYNSSSDDQRADEATYPLILGNIVRQRFYHGYLAYNVGNNFLAMLAGKITGRSYDAVIDADDILKFSEADCRQQSLVGMAMLIKKGYSVRAVFLRSKKYKEEHYVFETFYNGDWHLSDPDLEPDSKILLEKNRPSVANLAVDKNLLLSIYKKYNPDIIYDLFQTYQYGKINELIPARLYYFHAITKFLSYSAWIFCLLIYGLIYFYRPGYLELSIKLSRKF